VGLDHFKGRIWQGLHHHAALFVLAQHFVAHERLAALYEATPPPERTEHPTAAPATFPPDGRAPLPPDPHGDRSNFALARILQRALARIGLPCCPSCCRANERPERIGPPDRRKLNDFTEFVGWAVYYLNGSLQCAIESSRAACHDRAREQAPLRPFPETTKLEAIDGMRRGIAVVTGASTGIGRETAVRLAKRGYELVLLGRHSSRLNETVRVIHRRCPLAVAHIYVIDLLDPDSLRGLSETISTDHGQVEVLVNAAGVWHDDNGPFKGPPLHKTPLETIELVLTVGVLGTTRVLREFIPSMTVLGRGKVIQVGCGFAGAHEAQGWVHYYVANKAIEALTAGLAEEMRPYNVQVNCVAPWYVATDAVRRFFPTEHETALSVASVAKAIVHLTSSAADNISGQTIELRSYLDGLQNPIPPNSPNPQKAHSDEHT
jgi:NAD(P)-dependent dehydrogenase (short-subunit alcohol dehydrogenase family)